MPCFIGIVTRRSQAAIQSSFEALRFVAEEHAELLRRAARSRAARPIHRAPSRPARRPTPRAAGAGRAAGRRVCTIGRLKIVPIDTRTDCRQNGSWQRSPRIIASTPKPADEADQRADVLGVGDVRADDQRQRARDPSARPGQSSCAAFVSRTRARRSETSIRGLVHQLRATRRRPEHPPARAARSPATRRSASRPTRPENRWRATGGRGARPRR